MPLPRSVKSFSAMRAISAYRDWGRKQKHEVSLDYLMSETSFEPFATDNYLSSMFMKSRLFLLCKGKKLSLQVDG